MLMAGEFCLPTDFLHPSFNSYGRPRLNRKRARSIMQLLHPWIGSTAPRPFAHGPFPILPGRTPVVYMAGVDHPPLVNLGCGHV